MKSVFITDLILLFLDTVLIITIIWNIHSVEENLGTTRKICSTSECLTVSSTLLQSLDQTADPCDNFYQFVCGGFRKNVFLPNDEFYVTNTFKTSSLMEIKFNELLNQPIANEDPKYFKMMKTYYRACRNKRLIESEAEENLLKILEKLGGWPILEGDKWNETEFDWLEALSKAKKLGFPYDFYVRLETKSQKLHIRQGDPNKSYNGDFYKVQLLRVAKVLGASLNDAKVMKQINDTYKFDRKFNAIRQETRTLQIRISTLKQLENTYTFPWFQYLKNLLPSKIEIVPDLEISYETDNDGQFNFIYFFDRLLRNSSKRVQANALIWQIIQWASPYLTEKMFLKQIDYNVHDGLFTELRPRWKECVSKVIEKFKVGSTAIYTNKFLKKDIRPKITDIIRYIINNIKNESVEQVSKFEKLAASLKQVDETKFYIGFADQILNETEVENYYEEVELVGDNYLNLAMNLNIFTQKRKYLNFKGKEFDWVEFVPIFEEQVRIQPEIIMSPVHLYNIMYFQKSIPEYINFGFLEKIIQPLYKLNVSAKDDYDAVCNFYNNEYYPDSYVLDGTYLAYMHYIKNITHNDEILPGFENFTDSQLFFISFGTSRCIKRRPNFLSLDEANEHFVNLNSQNSKLFWEIFNCPKGSRMRREPDENVCVNKLYPF